VGIIPPEGVWGTPCEYQRCHGKAEKFVLDPDSDSIVTHPKAYPAKIS